MAAVSARMIKTSGQWMLNWMISLVKNIAQEITKLVQAWVKKLKYKYVLAGLVPGIFISVTLSRFYFSLTFYPLILKVTISLFL